MDRYPGRGTTPRPPPLRGQFEDAWHVGEQAGRNLWGGPEGAMTPEGATWRSAERT